MKDNRTWTSQTLAIDISGIVVLPEPMRNGYQAHEGPHKHEPLPNSCGQEEDKAEETYNEFLKLDAYREFRRMWRE